MDSDLETQLKQYSFRSKISRGGFCQVYQAVNLRTSRVCALKIINQQSHSANCLSLILNEGRLLRAVSGHETIIKLYDEFLNGPLYVLELELLDSSLHQLMLRRSLQGQRFTEVEVRGIIARLLQGLMFLHKKDIVHRDLKPENIGFANEADFNSLKIFDFGLSAKLVASDLCGLSSMVGTLAYMAPEMFTQKDYDSVKSSEY